MADKEYIERENGSICRSCFHSYVCEKFNEHRDWGNEKCHFFNDHFVNTDDVVEVVRCKDCVWFDPRDLDEDGKFWCEHTGAGKMTRCDYCSKCVRRDET